MALRNIRLEGDSALLKKSRPVTDFNKRLHILLDDMRETLIDADGVGLSAPQVGILKRAVVVLDTESENEDIIELINPHILEESGEQEGPEGCLSVPGVYGLVKRPQKVRIRAQDRFGKFFEMEREGQTARCFCHEIDHLDGHLFLERSERILSDEELEKYAESED